MASAWHGIEQLTVGEFYAVAGVRCAGLRARSCNRRKVTKELCPHALGLRCVAAEWWPVCFTSSSPAWTASPRTVCPANRAGARSWSQPVLSRRVLCPGNHPPGLNIWCSIWTGTRPAHDRFEKGVNSHAFLSPSSLGAHTLMVRLQYVDSASHVRTSMCTPATTLGGLSPAATGARP